MTQHTNPQIAALLHVNLERLAVRATEDALQAQKWFLKAKAERNHQIALGSDRLAAFYEKRCQDNADEILRQLEKTVGMQLPA